MSFSKAKQLKKNKKPTKEKKPWGMRSGTLQSKTPLKCKTSLKSKTPLKTKSDKTYKCNTSKVAKNEKSNLVKVIKHEKCNTAKVVKVKKETPEKMPEREYREKCDWIFSTYPICQICNKRKSEQAHHAKYGYRIRDDRTILAVCEPCHYEIHHGINGVSQSRQELETLGFETHDKWEKQRTLNPLHGLFQFGDHEISEDFTPPFLVECSN